MDEDLPHMLLDASETRLLARDSDIE